MSKDIESKLAAACRDGAAEMRERAANLVACSSDPRYACSGDPHQLCNACFRAYEIRKLPLPGDEP